VSRISARLLASAFERAGHFDALTLRESRRDRKEKLNPFVKIREIWLTPV